MASLSQGHTATAQCGLFTHKSVPVIFEQPRRAETECDGTRKRTGGEVKGKKANGGGSQQSCTVSDTVYPALLPLIRTPRLPAAD